MPPAAPQFEFSLALLTITWPRAVRSFICMLKAFFKETLASLQQRKWYADILAELSLAKVMMPSASPVLQSKGPFLPQLSWAPILLPPLPPRTQPLAALSTMAVSRDVQKPW